MLKHKDVNKMSAENLATCLIPNLLRPKTESMETAVADYPHQIALFSTMIEGYPKFFQKEIEEDAKKKGILSLAQ